MIDLIRSEWIKFRSVRSTLIMALAGGALTVLFAVLIANDQRGDSFRSTNHFGDVTAGVTVAIFLFGTLGVQIIGQEYRFNTIRPTLTAAPWRMRVLVAKLVVVCLATAVVAAIMLAICALIGTLMLDPFTIDGVDQRIIWATILFAMGWAMYGMALGAIVRQPIAGIVILLIQGLVAEPLLAQFVKATAEWVPFQNGVQMTARGSDDLFRPVLSGGIYFFVFTFVLWGIGAYLVNKRDA
ncbi:MAG TPA: ABC transporter permease [Acidimicrobiales bacterium]|nr:ABC transporter permease [Acidimicrobiales bacterium]